MRTIRKIIVHCSATPPSMDVGMEWIRDLHVNQFGWSAEGYHLAVTRKKGEVEVGRDMSRPGAHTRGHNKDSIGICLIGGVDENNKPRSNFTKAQMESLKTVLMVLKALHPEATIHGHNEFSNKACPSFDVQEWLAENGLV